MNRRDEIAHTLEQDICDGRLMPGQRLDEMELAQRFGVSRTPVRDALYLLSCSGMVQTRPHQGSYVAALSLHDLIELSEVLTELETMCAGLCARRMTAEERGELVALADATLAAIEGATPEAYAQGNMRFHLAIIRGSHNGRLQSWTQVLLKQIAPYRRRNFQLPGRILRSAREHAAMAQAIKAGDEAEARRLMAAHKVLDHREFGDLILNIKDLLAPEARDDPELFNPGVDQAERASIIGALRAGRRPGKG